MWYLTIFFSLEEENEHGTGRTEGRIQRTDDEPSFLINGMYRAMWVGLLAKTAAVERLRIIFVRTSFLCGEIIKEELVEGFKFVPQPCNLQPSHTRIVFGENKPKRAEKLVTNKLTLKQKNTIKQIRVSKSINFVKIYKIVIKYNE